MFIRPCLEKSADWHSWHDGGRCGELRGEADDAGGGGACGRPQICAGLSPSEAQAATASVRAESAESVPVTTSHIEPYSWSWAKEIIGTMSL